MELTEGSRVAIIGGGPAGTFSSYFLVEMANHVDLTLDIDIYEPQDFFKPGPAGCNHCGGIVSESLVQMLATEGIILPDTVVQRGLDSYVVHTERDQVTIQTPLVEKRIGAMHRGSGPKGSEVGVWESFDGFLLKRALEKGAKHIKARVEGIRMEDGFPMVKPKGGEEKRYDFVIGAVGVNYGGLKLFEALGFELQQPRTTKTNICEVYLGREKIKEYLGNSMHVFLLDTPRVEFAALIPKGDYVTFCMLGDNIDKELVESFVSQPVVKNCLPEDVDLTNPACKCFPRINIGRAKNFFSDRVVLVGDCGTSRLYKDGIGSAYRTAKAFAITAVFHGIAKEDFERFYLPACKRIERDNGIGKAMFMAVGLFRKLEFFRDAVLQLTRREQNSGTKHPTMSTTLWDMFTGSSHYRDIFLNCMKVRFLASLTWECTKAIPRALIRRVAPS